MSENGWYGFDLDGTLAKYDGWKAPDHIGEPITPMINMVKRFLEEGKKVRIFTARVALASQREICTKAIEAWCEKHIGQKLPVTHEKDFAMIWLYDDRCSRVLTNIGIIVE